MPGPAKHVRIAEPYPPPHEMQTKSRLEAGKVQLLSGGKSYFSEGVTLRTFSESNTPLQVIQLKDCIYDSPARTVTSAGPIRMETADGKFAIEGTGFFSQQTNSILVISNNVHTLIQATLLESAPTSSADRPTTPETGPLFIDSAHFSYDGPSGKGAWREHVVLKGTNLTIQSAWLIAEVPMKEKHLHSVIAETNVLVDYGLLHATGARLVYDPESGLARVLDHATWRALDQANSTAGQREGGGDELVIDRTNHVFQVNHQAWLKLPGQSLGEAGILSLASSTPTNSSHAAARTVEISCHSYELRTNWAIFREHVRLEERLDSKVRGSMNCEVMTVTFAGTNELETLTADKNVIMEQQGTIEGQNKKFTGGKAFYTHTNTTLEITENPRWYAGSAKGTGEVLRLNTQQSEMFVNGNASMRVPANELAGKLTPATALSTTNHPPRTGTNEFADIFCDNYKLGTNLWLFCGGVYTTHPEMNWTCETLTVHSTGTGLTNVIAHQNVFFDVMAPKQNVHGEGDDAVYTFGSFNTVTNGNLVVDELRLTGTPATLTFTNITTQSPVTTRNPVIIWNRATGRVSVPGSEYKLQGLAKPEGTNIFVLPKKKLTK